MNSFLKACGEGHFDIAIEMLQTDTISRNALLQQTDANGFNCLHYAADHCDVDFMRYLLQFKELDITARDHYGHTAFCKAVMPEYAYIGRYYQPEPCIEMITMLFEVNNDFVNCIEECRCNVVYNAICFHDITVVKLLINLGCSVNKTDTGFNSFNALPFHRFNALQVAADERRIDCIRYILSNTDCDVNIADAYGWLPCCSLIKALLLDPRQIPSKEEIDYALKMLLFTYKSPTETVEVYFMLLECWRDRSNMFEEIVRILLPHHPRKHYVEKILNAKLPNHFTIITLTLFEGMEKYMYKCKLIQSEKEKYLRDFERLKPYFLEELFSLYLADEPFFNEYITEVIRIGWKFKELKLKAKFYEASKITSSQKVFNFVKNLLFHKFDMKPLEQDLSSLLVSHVGYHLLNVFIPLSNFVHVPIQLIAMSRGEKIDCHFSFNESENYINDYRKLEEKKSNHIEVVSLKNLSRQSVRKYIFENYSHYDALSKMYSLDIPIELRQFLCYNFSNFKF